MDVLYSQKELCSCAKADLKILNVLGFCPPCILKIEPDIQKSNWNKQHKLPKFRNNNNNNNFNNSK